MLEIPPAMYPSLVGSINGGVDDDVFGDFVTSSSSSSSHISSLYPYHAPALRQVAATAADDEGWGGFFSTTLGSPSLQPHSSLPFSPPLDPCVSLLHQLPLEPSQLSRKGWEKPKGAIPLSIFGEEDVEEPESLERPGVFQNGFASHSLSSHSFSRPDPTGKLNDLLESPYVQAGSGKEQEDDFDEGSWEFKDAFSADTRSKLTNKGDCAIFGLEIAASANENGISLVDVNRLENGCKDMELYKTNNQQYIHGDILAAHEKLTVKLLGHNHSVTDEFLHEMLPNCLNGALRIGSNEFKLKFLENGIINESTEKIQADQADALYPPGKKVGKDIIWNMWDIDDLNISALDNCKNPYGNSEDQIEHNTGTGKLDDSPVAFTSIMENLYENADMHLATIPQCIANNAQEIGQHKKSSVFDNGDVDQFDWEFQNAAETVEAEKLISYDSVKILSSESTSYSLVEFYCRLKEESLSLIVHHLVILQVPVLPGATSEVKNINEEIQKAYGNLQEMMASKDACTSKKTAIPIDQLLIVTIATNFKAVEHEYSLSERLLASEKDLNAAVELFVHSSSVLQILRLASKEQQLFYINAWSKLASACAQELQLGSKIWTESLDSNISKQLLIKGNKYFIALGEVFRVSKILKATVTFYMPWLLSNPEGSSEIVICLEKSNEEWINSGLEETLRSISVDTDLDDMGLTKPLLESIKLIDKMIMPTYQDPVFHDKHEVCKFFLLPLDKLPEIKTAVWNGDCYVAKLVNFWANRISPDPPELPSIMPS